MLEGGELGSDKVCFLELTVGVQIDEHDTPSDWALFGLGVSVRVGGEEEGVEQVEEEVVFITKLIIIQLNILIQVLQIVQQSMGCIPLILSDEDREITIDLWLLTMT